MNCITLCEFIKQLKPIVKIKVKAEMTKIGANIFGVLIGISMVLVGVACVILAVRISI